MFVLAAALSASVAVAQPAMPPIETILVNLMRPGTTLQQYLDQRRIEFARIDADGDGSVTQADVEFDRRRVAAQFRASAIANILQSDLNGDGIVTRAEMRQTLETRMAIFPVLDQSRPGFREQLEAEITKQMQPDLNGDGRIDGFEMLAFARQRVPANVAGETMIVPTLALGDGGVTEARFLSVAEAMFRKVDADGDGTVTREEIEAQRRR